MQCKISIDFFQNHKRNIINIIYKILKMYVKKVWKFGNIAFS